MKTVLRCHTSYAMKSPAQSIDLLAADAFCNAWHDDTQTTSTPFDVFYSFSTRIRDMMCLVMVVATARLTF